MSISPHVATGFLIGLVIKEPILAVPVALFSHYILDALPHFGYYNKGYAYTFKHKFPRLVYLADLLFLIGLIALVWGQPWLVWLCGFVAIAPDLALPVRYFFFERIGKQSPSEGSRINMWHVHIQWCERPWGWVVELPLVIIVSYVISRSG